MKKLFLRFIYGKYRSAFYDFFVEEFLGEIPKDIREPAMTFLGHGKERLERWGLYQAHVLQSRLETDIEKIQVYKGMILMLKLLLTHTTLPVRKPIKMPETKAKPDYAAEAVKVTEEMKKQLSTSSEDK